MLVRDKAIKKISNYLSRKTHINYLSIQLISYNNRNLYIRFDYVERIKAYRILWFDLDYIDLKHLEFYTNTQLVASYFANKLVEFLYKINIKSGSSTDDKIFGDRVIFTNKIKQEEPQEFIFDRFLPTDWASLIDSLALVFSYLPRAMEPYLSEMFAIFDNNVDFYNSTRPIKLNIEKDNIDDLFDRKIAIKGRRLEERVTFLEKIEKRYLAIVEDTEVHPVIIESVEKDFYNMWCACEKPYLDEHIYATLQCIKDKKFKNFYKVKHKSSGTNLLEDVRRGEYFLAFGIEGNKLLIVSKNGEIVKIPLIEKGKVVFEVIEDDDNLSLSKILDSFK